MSLLFVLAIGARAAVDVATLTLRNGTVVDLWRGIDDSGYKLQCQHTRAELVQGVLSALDTNLDGCVDVEEMRTAFDLCLGWYAQNAR